MSERDIQDASSDEKAREETHEDGDGETLDACLVRETQQSETAVGGGIGHR
jgi:hypothetical protein